MAITTVSVALECKPRFEQCLLKSVACFCRDRPCPNVIRSKATPLNRVLLVIVPMFSAAPEPCSGGFALLTTGALVVRNLLVIKSHVIEVDVSARQNTKWPARIKAPESCRVIKRIIKKAGPGCALSDAKRVSGPITKFACGTETIEAPANIATITSRDKRLITKCHFLAAR